MKNLHLFIISFTLLFIVSCNQDDAKLNDEIQTLHADDEILTNFDFISKQSDVELTCENNCSSCRSCGFIYNLYTNSITCSCEGCAMRVIYSKRLLLDIVQKNKAVKKMSSFSHVFGKVDSYMKKIIWR